MKTIKDKLNFCNDALFYDYKYIGIIEELNLVYICIINRFYKTIPYTRILVSLSIIDDIILKILSNEIEKILEKIHDLTGKRIYMLSCEITLDNRKQKVIDDKYEDIDKDQSGNEDGDKYKYTLPISGLNSSNKRLVVVLL